MEEKKDRDNHIIVFIRIHFLKKKKYEIKSKDFFFYVFFFFFFFYPFLLTKSTLKLYINLGKYIYLLENKGGWGG